MHIENSSWLAIYFISISLSQSNSIHIDNQCIQSTTTFQSQQSLLLSKFSKWCVRHSFSPEWSCAMYLENVCSCGYENIRLDFQLLFCLCMAIGYFSACIWYEFLYDYYSICLPLYSEKNIFIHMCWTGWIRSIIIIIFFSN